MKKNILTAMAVFAFGLSYAQDVNFGAKLGLNIANLLGNNSVDWNSKVGFQIGIFTEIKVSDKFALQPELMISSQGAKSKYSDIYRKEESTFNLSYLNIPIIAKYYVFDEFNLYAGPQIGLLLSAKNKYNYSYEGSTKNSGTEDLKGDLKSLDFGFNFGAGFSITENISADLRYHLGLLNINKHSESDSGIQNKVFSIAVGYKF